MRTILRFVIRIQPWFCEEMVFETFVRAAHAGRALIRDIIGRVHKAILGLVSPHGTTIDRTLGVDTSVSISIVIGDDAIPQYAIEVRYAACIGPVMPRGRAVIDETIFEPCTEC